MTDFVGLPLEKKLNRRNILTRLERVERGDHSARPSLRAVELGNVAPDTGPLLGAGWIFDGDKIFADDGTVGMSSAVDPDLEGLDVRFWAGDAEPSDAPFRVLADGTLIASKADIAGDSMIGGWSITNTTIENLTVDNVGIQMDASDPAFYIGDLEGLYGVIDGAANAIYSSDYVAGQSGGRWDFETSTFEINNIIARGLIKTAVFERDAISAVGGSLMVLPSVELAHDMLANNGAHLFLPEHILAIGEIVRMKGDGDDEWMEIEDFDFNPDLGLWEYDVLRDKAEAYESNQNPQWKKGQAVVRYGPAGGGGVELTAGESPYIRVFDHDGSPWTSVSSIVQLDEGGIDLRNDSAVIAFRNSTETGYTGQIYGKSDDTFWVQGSHPGGAIRLSQLHASGTNSARLSVLEDPGNTGVSQITIDLGVNGTNWTIGGGEVVVWAGADGKETVFNDSSYDIDFRFEGTSGDVLKIDAGLNAVGIGGTAESGSKLRVHGDLRASNYARQSMAIADDNATSLTPDQSTGWILLHGGSGQTAGRYLLAMYRVGGSPFVTPVLAHADIATTTGALTGTTGTDGKFTVSAHTDGKLYFENRRGGSSSPVATFM